MSRLTITIITIVVLLVVYFFRLSRKNDKEYEELSAKRKKELHSFEYTLLPAYVDLVENNPDQEVRLIDASIWRKDIESIINPQHIDWDEISCEILGDNRTECVFFYDFPLPPFDNNNTLAKYGAIYINKQKKIYKYYTLEKTKKGYLLCSPSTKGNQNYGEKSDMSKKAFLNEVCNLLGIDAASLQGWRLAKRKASVKYYPDFGGGMKESSDANLDILTESQDNSTHLSGNESKDRIDFRAIHKEMYYVEYKLIPQLADSYKEHPEKAKQIVTTVYENLYILQNRLRRLSPQFIAFGSISCEIFGDIANECFAVYVYPKPIDMPLAKYGAIYFNRLEHEYKYWTFEFSEPGKYYLCSIAGEGRANHGARLDMSKEEFIHEVCQLMSVDETVFQQRNHLSRRNMLELTDKSLKDAIASCHLLAVCFYDFNEPSQSIIPVLEKLADLYLGKITFGVFDVYGGAENDSSIEDYSVRALPTILIFADGRIVDKSIGACGLDALCAKFNNLLKQN